MAIERWPWHKDALLAFCLLGLAVVLGFMFQWPLAQASLQGRVTELLDQKRQERRVMQFQGVKTLDLAQAYQTWQGEKLSLWMPARPKNIRNYTSRVR